MLEFFRMILKQLLNLFHDKFKLKTVLTLTAQLISCIEYIHSKSLIHDDIRSVYMIDFDFAQKYDSISIHIDEKSTDTACFVSIDTHQEIKKTYYDDMKFLKYMLIYLLSDLLS